MIQGFAVTWTANEKTYRREFTFAQQLDAVAFEAEVVTRKRKDPTIGDVSIEAMLEVPLEAPPRPSRPPARPKPAW